MTEMIDLVIFKNPDGSPVEGVAFMKCEFCKNDILLTTDKLTYCKAVRDKNHFSKHVFRLKEDNSELGFSKVEYFQVSMVNTRTLKELKSEA